MEWIYLVENINAVATAFREAMPGKKVFAFHGQMGAGKTTFIHALCDVIGVKDVVGSPTFSIINEYLTSDGHGGFNRDARGGFRVEPIIRWTIWALPPGQPESPPRAARTASARTVFV